MTAPWHFRSMVPLADVTSGQMSDTEVVASSSSALNRQALELASKTPGAATAEDGEPGATVQSHEVVMTIQFASLAGRNFMGDK